MQDDNKKNIAESTVETVADKTANEPKEQAVDGIENKEESSTEVAVTENEVAEISDTEVTKKEDEEEEEYVNPYVPKLTEKQQKMWQIFFGVLSGFLVWFSLALSSADQENGFLRWLFLIVFVAVMVIRSQIEKRTGVILRTFMKFFLIGLVVFLAVYVIYGLTSGRFNTPTA